MIDLSINEIAEYIEGQIIGQTNQRISGLNGLENANPGDLSFYYSEKYFKYLSETSASCVIVPLELDLEPKDNQVFIKTENPYQKFVLILKLIDSRLNVVKPYVHNTALIGDGCIIDNSVYIGANAVIGDNCKIGRNTFIYPNVTVYDNVSIGDNCTLHANCSLYKGVVIGNNCILHSGCVIGSDGFGYIENPEDGSFTKIPQLGIVELEDYVEIGANSTIDRALVGKTLIRQGTKIDNLVHIAHNCEIGENTGIAAQAGFSGSVKTGKRGRFGGQTGIAGHLEISEGVTLLAQSGVSKSIKEAGVYFGSPAKDVKKAFRIEAMLRNLPEMFEEVKKLKNK